METEAMTPVAFPAPSKPKWAADRIFGSLVEWGLIALVFLLPVFFLPFTIDPLEINKQTLLIGVTFFITLAWFGQMLYQKEVTLKQGVVFAVPAIFAFVTLLSTVISKAGFIGFVGYGGQEYTSFLTTCALVTLFYLITQFPLKTQVNERLFFAFLTSATLIATQMALQALGIPILSYDGQGSAAVNTVGGVGASLTYLMIVLIAGQAWWLFASKSATHPTITLLNKIFTLVLTLSTLFLLLAIDSSALWGIMIIGSLGLFTISMIQTKALPEANRFVMPMALLVVSLLFLFLKSPLHLSIPPEVNSTQAASWSIAGQTIQQHGLFGSGPGTYAYDYTQFRPADVLNSPFWELTFDRGASYASTQLATVGVIGLASFLLLIVMILLGVLRTISKTNTAGFDPTLFIYLPSWITSVIALFLVPANITILFVFWLLSALVTAQILQKQRAISFVQSPRTGLVVSFCFVLLGVGIITGLFVSAQRYIAEVSYAKAIRLDRQGGDIDQIIAHLSTANSYNQLSDVYYRNLAQALLIRIQKEVIDGAIPPDRINIVQQLVTSAVDAAKSAIDVAPGNPANWSLSGSIYREVSTLANGAEEFSVIGYNKAHELDPNNPTHLTDLGRGYLLFAENARALTVSEDPEIAAKAKADVEQYLQKGETVLLQSIALKADYAPAHYFLSLLYERQSKLPEAIVKMESVKMYNPEDVGVAFQLGVLYLREGEKAKAQAEFERAVTLSPEYANARWFLAAIYEENGELDKAIAQISEVARLNPGNEQVAARLERLESGTTAPVGPEPIFESDQPLP